MHDRPEGGASPDIRDNREPGLKLTRGINVEPGDSPTLGKKAPSPGGAGTWARAISKIGAGGSAGSGRAAAAKDSGSGDGVRAGGGTGLPSVFGKKATGAACGGSKGQRAGVVGKGKALRPTSRNMEPSSDSAVTPAPPPRSSNCSGGTGGGDGGGKQGLFDGVEHEGGGKVKGGGGGGAGGGAATKQGVRGNGSSANAKKVMRSFLKK